MYKLIRKVQEFGDLLSELSSTDKIGLDVEATTLDPYTATPLLLQINTGKSIFLLDWRSLEDKYIEYVIKLIKDSNKLVIGHNLKYDIKIIYHHTKIMLSNLFDTMLAELIPYIGLKYKFSKLSDVVEKYCFVILNKEVRNSFIDYTGPLTNDQLTYSALDVKWLFDVADTQLIAINKAKQEKIFQLEMDVLSVVAKMEYFGIILDREEWTTNLNNALDKADKIRLEIINYLVDNLDLTKYNNAYELISAFNIPITSKRDIEMLTNLTTSSGVDFFKNNINISSPKQCLTILNFLGVPVTSTGEGVIDKFSDQKVVELLLLYREYTKRADTYGNNVIDKINPITNAIHSEFDQLKVSGRFGSSNPNLQNQPRLQEYRRCYKARKGYKLLTADLSQAELRLLGAITGEPVFIQAYKNEEDIHVKSAMILFDLPKDQIDKDKRFYGKTLNFSLNYGISAWGLYKKFKIPKDMGEKLIAKYFEGLPYIKAFIDIAGKAVWKNLCSITPYGRRRLFVKKDIYIDIREESYHKAEVMREGVNHIIQGGIADIIKISMVEIDRNKKYSDDDFRILLQVHDELVIEVKEEYVDEAVKFVQEVMENVEQRFLGEIPAKVDITVSSCWEKE